MSLQMSLLRIKDGTPMSVGDIVGSVEPVEGKVQVPHFASVVKAIMGPCRTFAPDIASTHASC